MFITTGRFETDHGNKYAQQLCKHFAHKIEATFEDGKGVCLFEMGTAFLVADKAGLTVRFEVKDAGDKVAAHRVIDAHLERFAFRENFTNMTWDS